MSNRDARTDFLADAEETFAFLLEREGFDGPERVDNGLVYHSVNLAIEVLFDPRYQGAYTVIAGMAGEHHRRVNLSCVYTEAGLDPPRTSSRRHEPSTVNNARSPPRPRRYAASFRDSLAQSESACSTHATAGNRGHSPGRRRGTPGVRGRCVLHHHLPRITGRRTRRRCDQRHSELALSR